MPELDFAGTNAIVTGASSGIGKAIARALLTRGAQVAGIARDIARLEFLGSVGAQASGRVSLHQADLGDEAQVRTVADELLNEYPHIDLLVHSAGIIRHGTLEQTAVVDLDAQYRINMRAPFMLTQRLAPALIASQGQVVFINSSAGVVSRSSVAAYAGTKHGLRAIADSVREELGPRGVRILSVFPGRTATPLQAALYAADRLPYVPEQLLQPEDVATIVLSAIGLPRTAEVTEIHIRPAKKP